MAERACLDAYGPGVEEGSGHVPFSRCDLWSRQREYFAGMGLDAWPHTVPSFATSNAAIARSYAHVVFEFLAESSVPPGRPEEPRILLELGAGSGQFAFHFLRHFERLVEPLPREAFPRVVYVMADFHSGAVEAWRRHPDLAPFVARGILDFAVYDVESGEEVQLVLSGRTLSADSPSAHPLTVLANYVFDSVSHDVFRRAEGRFEELLIEPSPRVPDVEHNTAVPLSSFCESLAFRETTLPHYGEPELDAVLDACRDAIGGGYLSFPVGSLRCLLRLARCAGEGRMLLLAADKACARHLDLSADTEPAPAWHGSFSMTVDFDAVGRLFERLGGAAFHPALGGSLVASAFLSGMAPAELPATRRAMTLHLGAFGPGNLLALYGHLQATRGACSFEGLIGFLEVSGWDAQVFEAFYDVIAARLVAAGDGLRRDLAAALGEVAAAYYFLPGGSDTPAKLGAVLLDLGEHRAALAQLERSLHLFGPASETQYKMGLCHYALGELSLAAEKWQAALGLDPGHILARGWLARLARDEHQEETAHVQPSDP